MCFPPFSKKMKKKRGVIMLKRYELSDQEQEQVALLIYGFLAGGRSMVSYMVSIPPYRLIVSFICAIFGKIQNMNTINGNAANKAQNCWIYWKLK